MCIRRSLFLGPFVGMSSRASRPFASALVHVCVIVIVDDDTINNNKEQQDGGQIKKENELTD
jgi:hypothetical protein